MNTTTGLTHFEQRGFITYMMYDYTFKTVEGWFSLNGGTVVMRKIRGRNSFFFCEADRVDSFEPYDKELETFIKEMNAIVSRTNQR
jgi:hypothetical protein